MRNQYAGDISDLLKIAFLRALAAGDRTLGVAWYYNPEQDNRLDGRHREYCNERKWESLDAVAWDALRNLPERSVHALEKLQIWPPGTRFFRDPVPSKGKRHSWLMSTRTALEGSDIIFLDPDNGVGPDTKRHATVDEVKLMMRCGRSVVLIKFPARENHDRQLRDCHDSLRIQTGAGSIATVRTCVCLPQPRSRWFTIINADNILLKRAGEFAHKLNEIEKCSAKVDCWQSKMERRSSQTVISGRSKPASLPPQPSATDQTRTVENTCPECGHKFKGNGFDGIDAHWRSKHESVMPYREAWPLVKAGSYPADRPSRGLFRQGKV